MPALIPDSTNSPINLKEAESFLDALKHEVRPAGILNNDVTEEMDVDEQCREPPSRRESGIWEGTFAEEESPRRLRFSVPAPLTDNCKISQSLRTETDLHLHVDTFTAGLKSSPGIWLVELSGLPASSVAKPLFDVSPEMALAAKKWCDGPESESDRTDHLIVNLCCHLESDLVARGIIANNTDCLEKLQAVESSWSLACLCVQINGHVWLPSDLTYQSGPIDISQSIRPGPNELELVQISSTSRLVFVLTATHPSEEAFQHTRKKKRLLQLIQSRSQPKELVVPVTITA